MSPAPGIRPRSSLLTKELPVVSWEPPSKLPPLQQNKLLSSAEDTPVETACDKSRVVPFLLTGQHRGCSHISTAQG